MRWQLASVVHAHGYRSVHELSRDDLVALTPEAAEITRLPYDAASARGERGRARRVRPGR